MQQMQDERRDALFQLDDETREMVLEHQYDLPFLKLLAMEGAKQSPLQVHANDRKSSILHEGVRYKVFCIEDMLIDRGVMNNAITEHAILRKASLQNLPHIAHLQGTYIGFSHVAFALKEYEMDYRTYLEQHRDPKHLPKILDQLITGVESLH